MTNIYCLAEGNFADLKNLSANTEELVDVGGLEPPTPCLQRGQ